MLGRQVVARIEVGRSLDKRAGESGAHELDVVRERDLDTIAFTHTVCRRDDDVRRDERSRAVQASGSDQQVADVAVGVARLLAPSDRLRGQHARDSDRRDERAQTNDHGSCHPAF